MRSYEVVDNYKEETAMYLTITPEQEKLLQFLQEEGLLNSAYSFYSLEKNSSVPEYDLR